MSDQEEKKESSVAQPAPVGSAMGGETPGPLPTHLTAMLDQMMEVLHDVKKGQATAKGDNAEAKLSDDHPALMAFRMLDLVKNIGDGDNEETKMKLKVIEALQDFLLNKSKKNGTAAAKKLEEDILTIAGGTGNEKKAKLLVTKLDIDDLLLGNKEEKILECFACDKKGHIAPQCTDVKKKSLYDAAKIRKRQRFNQPDYNQYAAPPHQFPSPGQQYSSPVPAPVVAPAAVTPSAPTYTPGFYTPRKFEYGQFRGTCRNCLKYGHQEWCCDSPPTNGNVVSEITEKNENKKNHDDMIIDTPRGHDVDQDKKYENNMVNHCDDVTCLVNGRDQLQNQPEETENKTNKKIVVVKEKEGELSMAKLYISRERDENEEYCLKVKEEKEENMFLENDVSKNVDVCLSEYNSNDLNVQMEIAKFKLSNIFQGGQKKLFHYDRTIECKFCKRKGHFRDQCPTLPNDSTQRVDNSDTRWIEKLIMSKEWKVENVTGMSWEDGQKYVEKLGQKLNVGNPWEHSDLLCDSLRKRLGYWKAMGADQYVLRWLAYGVELKFVVEPDWFLFPNHRSYNDHQDFIDEEHEEHIADGSYKEKTWNEMKVSNPIQVEVSLKGKKRMCVDCRWTNAFVPRIIFKMETLTEHLPLIVNQGELMISTDIQKAYYAVPLHPNSQPYLGWCHKGKFYIPTVLIFGYSLAPWVFTKIMAVMLRFMKALRVKVTGMIDDYLWVAKEEDMPRLITLVKYILPTMGWRLNEKCVWIPSHVIEFLGMTIDLKRFVIEIPEEKRRRAAEAMEVVSQTWIGMKGRESISEAKHKQNLHKTVTLLNLQIAVGRVMSLRLALKGVRVMTRGLYRIIATAQQLKYSWVRLDNEPLIWVRQTILDELSYWRVTLEKVQSLPIKLLAATMTLNVDASDLGWGAVLTRRGEEDIVICGQLPMDTMGSSSTLREIAGLYEAGKKLINKIEIQNIHVLMDSMPAVKNLIKEGGPVFELSMLVKEWMGWCERNRIQVTYEWVCREDNTKADAASKQAAAQEKLNKKYVSIISEWTLTRDVQNMLNEILGDKGTRLRWSVYFPKLENVELRIASVLNGWECVILIIPRESTGTQWYTLIGRGWPVLRGMGTMIEISENKINDISMIVVAVIGLKNRAMKNRIEQEIKHLVIENS